MSDCKGIISSIFSDNRYYIVKIENRNSPIKSEEEFWNPSKYDTTDSTEDETVERMRAQFRKCSSIITNLLHYKIIDFHLLL